MATRPIRRVSSLTLTYTALTAEKANELYSGSLTSLSDDGFTITKTGDGITEKNSSLSYSITIPLMGGTQAGLNLDSMKSLVTEVSGSVLPSLKQELTNAGLDDQDVGKSYDAEYDTQGSAS